MKTFTCRHTVDCAPDQFWELIHFGGFNRVMYDELLGFGYEVIEDDRATGKRRTHITPVVDAPKALLNAFGGVPSFQEIGQYHAEPRRYEFHIEPSKLASKIQIHGTMRVEAAGAGKCVRSVEFHVGCSIFGIGGLFEHFVSKEIQRSYERSGEFTNTFLSRGNHTDRAAKKESDASPVPA